jgi:hypothetical protein
MSTMDAIRSYNVFSAKNDLFYEYLAITVRNISYAPVSVLGNIGSCRVDQTVRTTRLLLAGLAVG